MCKNSICRRNHQLELEFDVKPYLNVLFWSVINGNELVLVLPNQAGEKHHKTEFFQTAPTFRYEVSSYQKNTHTNKMLTWITENLLPYNGKVCNSTSQKPIGEESWLDYYFEFDTEEDKLNFLLAWV